MSMFIETIAAEHEYRHTPDDTDAYNESSYYNFASPTTGLIGWLRVAIQANQPAAQATALIFLPTGETLFSFVRDKAVPADALIAGPITFQIVEPHRKQQLSFNGRISVFTDGRALNDPGAALRAAPTEQAAIELSVTGLGDSFGASGNTAENVLEESLALGHYEQFIHVSGDIRLGERTVPVDGVGLRDHSWGPRDWAGPVYYRWIIGALDDGSALMLLEVERRDGGRTRRAAIYADGRTQEAELRELSVQWTDDGFCREARCEIAGATGTFELVATAHRAEQFVPLRHRRPDENGEELLTRIGYAPYTFRTSDGRQGYGICEVLDQMIDGRPLGMGS